jgi:hypothetical protein
MPDLWYYGKNGERHGPIPLKELKEFAVSGNIAPADPVWSPGMADWMAASEVEGLLPVLASSPVSTLEAAATPAVAPAAQESAVAEERWHYEYQGERRGPVSSEEIAQLAASGQIQPNSLVWKRGMAEWSPAAQVEGLLPTESGSSTQSAVQPGEPWYYGDGEQRHGPVSLDELKALASCGRLQPDHMVWDRGMAEWTTAAEVQGLIPVQAKSPAAQPVAAPAPSLRERVQSIRDAAAPHLSHAATATQANLERSRKFVHRQHLGTRLRLLISRIAEGMVWCYNAACPHVLRVWSKRPSKQEVRDWSAAKAQQASEAWKQTAPQRTRLAQQMSVKLGEAREGTSRSWKATVKFSVRTWDRMRVLGTRYAIALRGIWSSLKPKAQVVPPTKPEIPATPVPSSSPSPPEFAASVSEPLPATPTVRISEPDLEPMAPAVEVPAHESAPPSPVAAVMPPEPEPPASALPVLATPLESVASPFSISAPSSESVPSIQPGLPHEPEPAALAAVIPTTEPAVLVADIPAPTTQTQPGTPAASARTPKPVIPAVTVPQPDPVAPAVRVPPPMPKPKSPASRVPPPMPKPMTSAAQVPPPMPKPKKPVTSAEEATNPANVPAKDD